ncbi:hypothetical protein [Micromonospora sp. CPCC 206061]|uniref:hypothetical protein n=1 Tax=Micromonospora sp. CPCC 206061 TaxID=3122410 RepID=UPI002FEEA91B
MRRCPCRFRWRPVRASPGRQIRRNRGPRTIPVRSIADIVFVTSRTPKVQEVNEAFRQEAETERYRGILGVSEDPLVSADIVGDPRAAVVDLDLTRVVDGSLVKVMAWYDNEWGFSHQMIREAHSILCTSHT